MDFKRLTEEEFDAIQKPCRVWYAGTNAPNLYVAMLIPQCRFEQWNDVYFGDIIHTPEVRIVERPAQVKFESGEKVLVEATVGGRIINLRDHEEVIQFFQYGVVVPHGKIHKMPIPAHTEQQARCMAAGCTMPWPPNDPCEKFTRCCVCTIKTHCKCGHYEGCRATPKPDAVSVAVSVARDELVCAILESSECGFSSALIAFADAVAAQEGRK